jgi:hypothetical protein
MDLSEPEEPTCVLKMLSEFNRNVEVPNFPFVFERFGNVSQESSNNKPESDLSSVKKRRVEPHDSTLDSDMSISGKEKKKKKKEEEKMQQNRGTWST